MRLFFQGILSYGSKILCGFTERMKRAERKEGGRVTIMANYSQRFRPHGHIFSLFSSGKCKTIDRIEMRLGHVQKDFMFII